MPALLIDTDPQGSLAFWHELRQDETPVLLQCEAKELGEVIAAAKRDKVQWVFIDTPPHNTQDIAAAMRVADLAVIPLRPAVFDIAAVAATLEMAKALKKPTLPVINSAPPRRGTYPAAVVSEAREAVMGFGVTPWAGQITQRAGFAHALASGQAVHEFEPESPAAKEMQDLWLAVRRAVGKEKG